jgi:hypothetical protein
MLASPRHPLQLLNTDLPPSPNLPSPNLPSPNLDVGPVLPVLPVRLDIDLTCNETMPTPSELANFTHKPRHLFDCVDACFCLDQCDPRGAGKSSHHLGTRS